jgi:hypothetical protein
MHTNLDTGAHADHVLFCHMKASECIVLIGQNEIVSAAPDMFLSQVPKWAKETVNMKSTAWHLFWHAEYERQKCVPKYCCPQPFCEFPESPYSQNQTCCLCSSTWASNP